MTPLFRVWRLIYDDDDAIASARIEVSALPYDDANRHVGLLRETDPLGYFIVRPADEREYVVWLGGALTR